MRALIAGDRRLVGTFAQRTTYMIGTDAVDPALRGSVRPTAIYASYAAFAADIADGRLEGARAVLYDIEKWQPTPLDEQRHPRRYMLMFSKLARAHGLLPVLAPGRDLTLVPGGSCVKRTGESLDHAYIRCALAGADVRARMLVVQSQVDESSAAQFRRFLLRAATQARARNPQVAVLAQLSTAPLDRVVPAVRLVAAARSVEGFVQGFSLNVRTSDLASADLLLRSLR